MPAAPPIAPRSPPVPRPTPAMREAMARAEVGDDVYGEDTTVNRLEERVAELLGKEADDFAPSGTRGNQSALQGTPRGGVEGILGQGSPAATDESGDGPAGVGGKFRPSAREG